MKRQSTPSMQGEMVDTSNEPTLGAEKGVQKNFKQFEVTVTWTIRIVQVMHLQIAISKGQQQTGCGLNAVRQLAADHAEIERDITHNEDGCMGQHVLHIGCGLGGVAMLRALVGLYIVCS